MHRVFSVVMAGVTRVMRAFEIFRIIVLVIAIVMVHI